MKAVCSIPDCEKPAKGRGWCAMHWYRWRKHGDPLKVAQRGVDWQVKPTCSVDGCERPHHAKSYCEMHHRRWAKHGDPLHEEPIAGRPLSGDVPTIHAIHKRLQRSRGPASNYPCVDCGGVADDWSYNNAAAEELLGAVGDSTCPYSLDLADYDPRCRSCHRIFDQAGQRTRDESGRFVATVSVPADNPRAAGAGYSSDVCQEQGEGTGARPAPAEALF